MSKIKLSELNDMEDVTLKWSPKYGCPIIITRETKIWVPMTGEFGGYWEECDE